MERTRRRHVRSPLDTATPVAIRVMGRTRRRHVRSSPSSSSSMKRLTPPRRRSPSERWNDRHVRSSRSPPHATSHALPRAALKLPSQDDKGRAATVGGRRGRVTSMFSIPLRARCTPRCNADACRRRDDARGGQVRGRREGVPRRQLRRWFVCEPTDRARRYGDTWSGGSGADCAATAAACSHLFLRARCAPRCDVDVVDAATTRKGPGAGTPGGRSPTPTATVARMRANRSRPPVRRHLVWGWWYRLQPPAATLTATRL